MKRLPHSRRTFLRHAATAAAALASVPLLARADRRNVNEEIRVGIIGLGNKGKQHASLFSSLPGTRVAAVCDVDPERLAAEVERQSQAGRSVFATADARRIIDRADVDAVVIATPNHWHVLLAIWALRAGKDVYVEKPVSHNLWEGERLVAETRATGRIVQAGLQYRSCPGLRAAAAWLREGHLGRPVRAHIVWYEHRPAIGRVAPHTPSSVDYDLWCGPAPVDPLRRPRLHYDWHWAWATGNGDVGNSSVHAFDACRMFLPGAAFPSRTVSLGGRFTYDDAAETPNTQFTVLDYPDLPVLIENRNLSMVKDRVILDHLRGIREGFVLHYEGGYFAGLRAGGRVYDPQGRELKRFDGSGGADHAPNFLRAVRSRRAEDLHCPIHEGHVSSGVCHLGNVSYRLGRPGNRPNAATALGGPGFATDAFERVARSVEGLGVDFNRDPLTVGAVIESDPVSGHITRVSGGDPDLLVAAGRLERGAYRAPFVLPT